MGRIARVTLALLVWVSLTLTCQGHDVGALHSGVHLALFAHHHDEAAIGQDAITDHSLVQTHVAQVFEKAHAGLAMDISALGNIPPSDIKVCGIGPSSGSPEAGDIITIGAGEGEFIADVPPRYLLHESVAAPMLVTQSSFLPEEPPPRDA